MPVYNGERYLAEAIDSILTQTFTDFEFLIVNDGSTDTSRETVIGYQDPRIRLVDNCQNLGLVTTLNKGLGMCVGRYVARMDCDDIANPQRLARQVEFMDANPEIGVCGSWYERFDGAARIFSPPCDDRDIRLSLAFENTFGHNTVMLRRDFIERHGLRYDPSYAYAEDYEFWVRCSRLTKMANLPEPLVRYRFHPENTSSVFAEQQRSTADRVREGQLAFLRLAPDPEELRLHHAITHHCFTGGCTELELASHWIDRFTRKLSEHFAAPVQRVHKMLSLHWYVACGMAAGEGLRVWRIFMASPVGRAARPVLQAKLLLRCLMKRPIPGRIASGTLNTASNA